jgi:lipoprotein-anchoring transpeptidase ErfK/SrfK
MTGLIKRSSRTGAVRRSWTALLCVCAGLAASAASASASTSASTSASASTAVKATQQLAVLHYEHRAYAAPRATATRRASVPAHRPITGQQTTLPVLAQATDRHGLRWLKVMLPGRPNSSTGWIKRAGTQDALTTWSIHVNTASRHVFVYHHGRLTRTFSAVVGKPSTPTPTGQFFLEETVIMPASDPGGPFALALSARSNVLQEFDGGPGQIAIHGRDSLGGTIGQAESHGCIRLVTAHITWLAVRIPIGTRVQIN